MNILGIKPKFINAPMPRQEFVIAQTVLIKAYSSIIQIVKLYIFQTAISHVSGSQILEYATVVRAVEV